MPWGSFNLNCFFSQQVAERAFETFLHFSATKEVRGHSVRDLYRESPNSDSSPKNILSLANTLKDKFYLITVCANLLPKSVLPSKVNEEDTKLAHNKVKEKISI